ncbi:intermembrane lipid transfer protein VPS13A-like [Saccoglossus kowalevskii]
MVFESIITDLMNKYLGDFVENLDKSQLKLSIWGGDIVLQNLDLKESALDDLDLPIKVKSGHLGKLTLKIPWKSLYSSPVVANIDGLYVLAVPNIDIKYDAEKDAKQKEEKKQKELEKVEQAKELARQKEKGKSKEQKADSFAEKMAFQIVKNLQVQISNIHVRYEDKYTNPESPFAVGATLHDLSFQTCDANWKKCLIDSASNMIFKLIELDCLALYWNTNSRLYSDLPRSQLQNVLKGGIAAREKNIPPYDYMIKPISMKSQLRINPKPASDLETPKVYFNLILEEIAVSFSKKQFRDTMEMLESFERMSRNEPYRKYRPSVPLKGHAKEWWHYAQSSILEETVKRRTSMWSWSSMSKHRELGKQYKEVWKEKLKTKKPTKKLLDTINSYEQHLNVFNIVLARQQAETEVAKSGSKVTKSKSEEKGKSKGWFGGYFGGKKKKETEETEENKYKSQFAEAMSPAEKAKLFQAIGYSESGAEDPTFPVDYIGMKLHFTLKKTSLQLRDTDLKQPDIVKVVVDDLYASLQQRPSGNAIRLESKIDSFSVFGAQHENGEIPQMVKSQKGDGGSVLSLLNLQVETNPLDGKADQRITVTSRPLEIIYDAVTINHVADFFKTPEDVHLSELQAAAMSTLDTIRNQSATGMNYMIQSRKVTDISVDIKGSYAIIPENGIYDSSASLIIANLGDFKMQSLQADKLAEWRRQLAMAKALREQCVPIEDLLNKAYDKFSLKLQSVQVILAKPGEDWKAAILEPKSALHVLQPTELSVELHKCMLTNDTRVPQVRIVGELPQLNVQISDQKIHELIKIADSIPLPKSDSPSPSASQKMAATVPEQLTAGYEVHAPTNLKIAGHQDVDVVLESDSDTESTVCDDFFTPAQSEEDMIQKFGKEGPLDQLTQLELNFEIKEVALNVSRFKDNKEIPLIGIAVQNLGTEVTIRTFDINVAAFVGSITVEHKHFTAPGGAGPLYLVSTPTSFKQEDNLLSVHYKKADKKSPEFYTTYEKTEQSIIVSFTALEVVAHLSAILGLLDFVDTVVPKSDEVSKEPDVVDDEGYISDDEKKQKRKSRQRYTRPEPRSEIDVKVMADLDTVSLVICSDAGIVATAKVNGLKAGVMVQRHQTRIEASLKDIAIHDPMPNAAYPKILSIKDAEVFHLNIVAHNSATVGEWYSDMSSVDTEIELNLGRIDIVFLNKFVMEILDFIDHFQAAKDAVKDASASAASTAAAKVQNLHERSARVVLDITIQAPLIIIPQNSLSLNAIIADLGVLTVSNSFSIAGENTDKYIPPIVDTMIVKLSSVKLGRVRMEENRIKSEVSILEPVDIIIEIKRNLAASWYHQIPDIDIGGKIPAMKVALGQDDFTMVMATLDENLQEGQKEKPKKAPTEPTVKPTDEKKRRGSTKGTTIIEITPKSKAVWTKLIFNFYIESISAALFTGKTDLMSGIGIVDRNPDSGLSKVDLCMVGVDGTMWTDDSMHVLQPCTISLHLSQPTNEGQHIDIAVTEIALSASPRIIQTMSAIAASMKPPSEPDEEEKRKAKESIPVDLWTVKHLQDCNFWFLKEAKPIDDDFVLDPCDLLEEDTPVETRGDQLLMKIEKIRLTLEAGIGTQTLPMIMLEANVTTEVKDWTSKLYVSSDISMDVSYYNIGMAEWEPLLEPVEVVGGHRPWELNIEVKKNEEENGGSEDDDSTIDLAFALPVMTVSISSNDILELTMTKSCISLLTNLGKAFGEAVDQPSSKSSRKVGDVIPPFIVKNCLGKDITVEPGSVFEESKESNGRIVMKPEQKLPLNPSTAVKSLLSKRSFLKKDLSDMRREISVQVKDFKEIFNIPIHRAGRRLYNLQQTEGYPHILYSIVIDVEADMGSKIVNIRSPLRVHNHMPFAMDLYSTGSSNEMMHFGSVGANELGTVPLVPSHGQNIFAKPHDMHYRLCDSGISWKKSWDLKETGKPNFVYRCSFEKPGHAPYYFTVSIEKDEYTYIKGSLDKTPTYTLHVLPTVRVKNLLPVKMKCVVQDAADEISLGEGEVKPLFNADLGKVLELRIPDYLEKEWTAKMTLRNGMKELSGLKFTAYQGTQEVTVELGIFVDYNKGFKDMAVYAPYWMVNKTGLPLSYRGTDDKNITFHPESMEEPVLFAFHKQLLGKKMASLKVLDSDWSNKFSLDTVGSSGAITCKTKEMNYEIGVKIHLTHAALTKVVTFTPMYLVVNHAEFAMSVSEEETDEWREIPPGECVPLWPVSKNKKEPKLRLKKLESDVVSDPFVFTKPGSVLLQVDDPKVGGVGVLINVSDWSNIISLNAYHRGAATVQIINHCTDTMVQYKQSGHVTTKAIGPKEAVLYTWQDPCGKKELSWAIDKTTKRDALITDGIGEVDTVDGRCYWISFLDGMQRTLMFTEDLLIATVAQQAGELEQADMEILLSLQGIGMSLVNNQTGSEILYMGITSSGIMWEFQKRRRWKSLTNKQNQILETAFQNLQTQLAVGKVVAQGPQTLEGNLEVDFFAMKMLKPNKRKIRRTYAPGIWASYKASEHQLQLHAKINRLQIDNQLPASVFPTVLAPVPPPKSVSAESEPKPFIELSNMTRYGQHTQIKQVKYFKLLIQEMHAKVDQGFLNALMLMFESEEPTPEQELEYFEVDVEKTASKLKDSQEVQTVMGEDRNFYDNLHLSPIKTQGLYRTDAREVSADIKLREKIVWNCLSRKRLGFFERQHQFYTTNELTGEGIKHYSSQAIKQAYVLVLGLDVLGNPFGFVRGLTEGVTDLFYEPYQGAVQGPEEFAEGLALGVRSLFGHAVGGAAGVVSRVTGTLGKGLAALTMDEEYQKKRLKAMNQRPADLKEGLARGGKGLVMGFVEGVSGIVVQPVKGAKKEGAAGFFKGVGKGLVGVVAKPTGGVIDMASSAFDGIRRVAEFSEEIRPLRPPRLIHDDGIVRPYVKKEAQGYGIFIETEKGKFVITDKYYAHAVVTKDGRCVLLVTNRRLLFVSKGDLLGHWNCEWQHTYAMLKEPPVLTEKGITILLKDDGQKKKRGFGSFFGGAASTGKIVTISDSKTAQPETPKKKKKKRGFASLFSRGSRNKVHILLEDRKEAQWLIGKIHEAMAKSGV